MGENCTDLGLQCGCLKSSFSSSISVGAAPVSSMFLRRVETPVYTLGEDANSFFHPNLLVFVPIKNMVFSLVDLQTKLFFSINS